MFDDLKMELRRLEEELLEEDFEEADEFEDRDEDWDDDPDALAPSRRNPALDFGRTIYEGEEPEEPNAVFAEEPKSKAGKLLLVLILDALVIYALLRWCLG